MTTTVTTRRYAIDAAHTTVEFIVRHLMIAKVRGRFAAVTGTIDVADGSNLPVAADVTIDVRSIDTREEQRDAHLRSADFFDADNHGQITFRSTSVAGSADAFTLTGDLTIHGVTREVALAATFEGRAVDPWGNQRIGYEAHATISRSAFGLSWNQALETGGVIVGDEVKIELNLEAIAAK